MERKIKKNDVSHFGIVLLKIRFGIYLQESSRLKIPVVSECWIGDAWKAVSTCSSDATSWTDQVIVDSYKLPIFTGFVRLLYYFWTSNIDYQNSGKTFIFLVDFSDTPFDQKRFLFSPLRISYLHRF